LLQEWRWEEGLPVCDFGHWLCGSHNCFPFVSHVDFLMSWGLRERESPWCVEEGWERRDLLRWVPHLSLCSFSFARRA
jgi:hypothetical protein